MISTKKILDELLNYEKKWCYHEFKRFYKNEQDFIKQHNMVIDNNPNQLYRYVTDMFDEIIKYEDLNNVYIRNRLHATTDLLIDIGIYLQEQNFKIL